MIKSSGNSQIIRDITWLKLDSRTQACIPAYRRKDIIDKGSLTQRLIEASGGDFKVKVVEQSWQKPELSERNCLGLKENEEALIREVELSCQSEVWVLARSVIPKSTLVGELEHLGCLGDKPLGASLFKLPNLERTLFEVCELKKEHLPELVFPQGEESCWGRRSVFRVEDKPILVSEFFLPACPSLHS